MFSNNTIFVIHRASKTCTNDSKEKINTPILYNKIKEFLTELYPKNKTLHLAFKILTNYNMINDELFFHEFPSIHIADFVSFINNRFAKKDRIDAKLLKLCKYIQNKGVRLPKITVRNPVAADILT